MLPDFKNYLWIITNTVLKGLSREMDRSIITINEPVDYMVWAVMILMPGKDITRAIGRVGP